MVTIRIGGYDVKRVLVDQGSGAEIMYPDLYGGLNLRLEDLESVKGHLWKPSRQKSPMMRATKN